MEVRIKEEKEEIALDYGDVIRFVEPDGAVNYYIVQKVASEVWVNNLNGTGRWGVYSSLEAVVISFENFSPSGYSFRIYKKNEYVIEITNK